MRFNSFCNWWINCHRCLLQMLILFGFALLSLPKGSLQGPHERRLLNDLLAHYDRLERPVANESEALKVRFGLSLQQIIDVEWTDSNLRWNTSDYGGVKDLRIPTNKIWIPDILMYNSADEKFDSTFRTNVVVNNNGTCLYVPPGVFKSTCQIDITWFPFDDQKCTMKFGSWTYDGFSLDLQLSGEEGSDLTPFLPNGEWVLVGAPAKRNLLYYECCPEPYVDITFTIHIKRRTLYYGFNLIIPCVILSSMTLLGFSLPPDSGEKLQLGVTILLSMTVFLVQLGKILPATSESISIIAAYFASIMVMVAFSVVMTVVVLNFHHRTSETHEMNYLMKAIMLEWLPWILRMDRHGIKPPRRITASVGKSRAICKPSKQNDGKDFEMLDNSKIQSHLFDSFLNFEEESKLKPSSATMHQLNDPLTTNSHANALTNRNSRHCNHLRDQNSQHNKHCNHSRDQIYQHNNHHELSDNDLLSLDYLNESPSQSYTTLNLQNRKTREILLEMRFITNRMRRDDDIRELIAEWKFAATVIDRLCLIVFSLFTVISTALCLLSAPQLIV